jgi:uracil-DNA glycosylase
MRKGRQKHYWTLINNLSKENFVYLTDIYKTFFYFGEGKKQRSYDYFQEKNISKHKELLQKEIHLIAPDLIITFGKISYSKLMEINAPKLTINAELNIAKFKDIPVLPMVHLSSREKSKRDFLKNNNVDNENIGYGYYHIIQNFLNTLKNADKNHGSKQ